MSKPFRFLLFAALVFAAGFLYAEDIRAYSTSSLPLGPVTDLKTDFGTWTAPAGTASVLNVPNQPRRSLHFCGQPGDYLTLVFPKAQDVYMLKTELERWTGRAPFDITVEARYCPSGKWAPILKLEARTPVGFGRVYNAPVNGQIDAIRFSGQTFPKLGLLIHELGLCPPGPMSVTVLETVEKGPHARRPILLASQGDNPLTGVQTILVRSNGMEKPLTFDRVLLNVEGSRALKRLAVAVNGKTVKTFENIADGDFVADLADVPAESRTLAGLTDRVCIQAAPSDEAQLDELVRIEVTGLEIGKKLWPIEGAAIEYPFAVLVRNNGWDKANGYRIPGIVLSKPTAEHPEGVLVAVYDIRWKHCGDLPADIDIGVSRSFDRGRTWEPMINAINMEKSALYKDLAGSAESAESAGAPEPEKEGVGDPCILLDENTGRIWIAGLWAHNAKSTFASQPGLKMGTSGQLVLVYSDDAGATWSDPINITSEAAQGKDWRILFQGPGSGITLRDSTLVFPAQIIDGQNDPNRTNRWSALLVYSKDHGKTWTASNPAKFRTCEAQAVELNDGSVMLNMRNFGGSYRSIAVTKDLGQTWTEFPESDKLLVEPICQASLIRVASVKDGDKQNALAFFNPASPSGRVDMTVKLSFDEGKTWPRERLINAEPCFGYSAMTMLDKDTIGLLYETRGGLIFQQYKWNQK